ncbi:MAG TPA: GvpL/GvpF family gas vesicle protein [Pyrinomonadaceae bacterium]|nr:GvpL/GvpF family gas vesicle protein [Pyrinomonadaceae bacterium]
MKLYAYCLSDEITAGALESVTGLAGAPPRLVRCGKIAAVVSEIDAGQATVTRENVLAHEKIIRRVLATTTPLPFRFGNVVGEKQLQSYLETQQDSLLAQLERVRGCVEMSVKVIWDPEAIRLENEGLDAGAESAPPASLGSGTAFLLAKRREILGGEKLKERAAELAAWLSESLKGSVREERVSLQPAESLVLTAAHLIERVRLDEYRAALGRVRSSRRELHFLTSGAWPPYSFTSAGSEKAGS